MRQDDNVIPQARDIPAFINSLRRPRKRTISIGPQSEADVRELIAQRENKRRQSQNSTRPDFRQINTRMSSGNLEVGTEVPLQTPPVSGYPASDRSLSGIDVISAMESPVSSPRDEQQDKRMFEALLKPRVRYDVEVVTKLVIYAGIAWLAVEGNPLLFATIGLGMPK